MKSTTGIIGYFFPLSVQPKNQTELKISSKLPSDCNSSSIVGKLLAKRAIKKGIKQVIFDRGGNLYHGRVKALADAAREAGLEF